MVQSAYVTITASSSIDLKSRADLICHTTPNDPRPVVIFAFHPELSGSRVFLYNRCNTPEIAARLNGVDFYTSYDGQTWASADIHLTDEQIFQAQPIIFQLDDRVKYLKLSRENQGAPIHLAYVTAGHSLEQKIAIEEKLTKDFAETWSLPLLKNRQISEHPDPTVELPPFNAAVVRAPFIHSGKQLKISAVRIRLLGRFSNALAQISNAYRLAIKINANKIYLPPNDRSKSMFPEQHSLVLGNGDIELIIGQPDLDTTYFEATCYFLSQHKYLFQGTPTRYDAIQSFKRGLGYDYETDAFDDRELVIHVRSGDIFTNKLHRGYGQPPLAYYKAIIQNNRPDIVHLVYEDEGNPVINALKTYLSTQSIDCSLYSGTLREDIYILLKAKTLVTGKGTFLPGIIALSENVRTVYTFGGPIGPGWNAPVRNIVVRDVAGEFTARVLRGNWENSPEQRKLMLEYPESALEIARQSGSDAQPSPGQLSQPDNTPVEKK